MTSLAAYQNFQRSIADFAIAKPIETLEVADKVIDGSDIGATTAATTTDNTLTSAGTVTPVLFPVRTTVADEVQYWRDNIGEIASAEAFTEDERLFRFASKAFGYGDSPPNKGLAFIAFSQGVQDPGGFANRTTDYRLEEMVRQFAFLEFGLSATRDPVFAGNVEERYLDAVAAEDAPQSTLTINDDASYFKSRIGQVDDAADFVSDSRLYSYATTAFELGDLARNPSLVRQALEQGIDADTDLANTLDNQALYDMVRFFGLDDPATSNVTDAQFGESVVRKYEQVTGVARTQAGANESADSLYFRENIGKVRDHNDLVDDRRLYTYVMTAFDLSSEIDSVGIVRKTLEEGAADSESFSNQLSDPRFREMARVLGFAEFGTRNVKDPAMIDQIVSRFERASAEIEEGLENPVVELAAYFDRKADQVTGWIDVVADSRLRSVVTTALGLPDVFQSVDLNDLIDVFEERGDLTDITDPDKREDFIERYTILSDIATGGPQTSTSPLVGLFQGSAVSADSLYSLVIQL